MSINFLSIIAKPKITLTTNPFLVSSPLLFFSNKTKTKPSILTAFSSMSYDKELAAAKKAASLAARLCQARSLSLPLPVFLCLCTPRGYKVQKAILQSDVQSKSDKSPVTVADYGSQALVSYVLQRELPSELFSLVAEEDSEDLCKDGAQETLERITKLVNDILASDGSYSDSTLSTDDVVKAIDCGKSEGGSRGRHWVLDPIDGTKGFLRGDQYAIALALLDEGTVVLGVLACPNLPLTSIAGGSQHSLPGAVGCLFFSVVGGGTYMHSLDSSSAVKVQVSSIDNPEEASFFESYEAAHSMHDLSSSIAKKLGVKAPPVRIDSQAKYGALSRGDGVIYLRFPHKGYREKIWDHAAGYIVVAEAGGVVTDAAGNPLDFSKGRYLDLDTGIIVTNQKLMPSLLKAVRESIEEKVSSL
ncbi:hypothetical protein NC653_013097 [Populus alba x Populus x berolinensis]|uniref:3'(2'),5'-bisphosphate nucleotidase n=1 Tax=Populus alba x Populus x berolinensis TaxID=444605 RepID=A0AAD6QTJ4_9ROSI|nr:hypothetical protein NC653_013097 [Populus alba x Populus x berolinensis]